VVVGEEKSELGVAGADVIPASSTS